MKENAKIVSIKTHTKWMVVPASQHDVNPYLLLVLLLKFLIL